jgi:hypothetical protein
MVRVVAEDNGGSGIDGGSGVLLLEGDGVRSVFDAPVSCSSHIG